MSQVIQVRHDTAANWTSVNPVLALAEQGFETDTGKSKWGDGSTAWTSLSYSSAGGSASDATTSSKGSVQLAGDLAGTAGAPTVPGSHTFLGSGKDGAAVFNGSGAVTGCNGPTSSLYNAQRDLHVTSATFSNGVTLNMNGFRLFVQGNLIIASGTATITVSTVAPFGTNNSTSSSGGALGSTTRATTLGTGVKGADGVVGVGAAIGSVSAFNFYSPVNGASGDGGSGTSGAGGIGGSFLHTNVSVADQLSDVVSLTAGRIGYFDAGAPATSPTFGIVLGGRGGASGAGDGTNKGGAGGVGGCVIIVNAKTLIGGINITAPGAAGGTPTTGNCGGGGGGTGGVLLLNTMDRTGWTGTATAAGGAAGSGVGTGANGTAGAAGYTLLTTWL